MIRKTLTVIVEARSEATVDDMIEDLARVACDVGNSTEDDLSSVIVCISPAWDDSKGDHPEWSRTEWRQDVTLGDTRLGYAEWVAHNLESENA